MLIVRYPPRSTTVTVSTDQNKIVEGSSVTLTCSSDANPPMEKYTWYKRNGTEVSVLQGETESYTIPSGSLGYIDQYFCEAKNEIGAQNCTWDLTTDDRPVSWLLYWGGDCPDCWNSSSPQLLHTEQEKPWRKGSQS